MSASTTKARIGSRFRESDLMAYIEDAFAKTAERIAAGQVREDDVAA
jgi:hypothetical protein